MTPREDLISAWRKSDLGSPHALPEDLEVLKRTPDQYVTFDLRQYLKEGERRNDTRLHLGLMPKPWFGDLVGADVFILMLNPGLHPLDYFAEDQDQSFRSALLDNLHQKPGRGFPFLFLDPQFWWHPGGEYFRRRLGWLADRLAKKNGHSYDEGLAEIAKRVCVLQLVPYQSPYFGSGDLVGQLRSSHLVRTFVTEELARRKDVQIIVTRSAANWGLRQGKNVLCYAGSECRSAHMTPKTRGGTVLARRFGVKP